MMAGQDSFALANESAERDLRKLQNDLLESGALSGLEHEFHLAQGNVQQELESLIRDKRRPWPFSKI